MAKKKSGKLAKTETSHKALTGDAGAQPAAAPDGDQDSNGGYLEHLTALQVDLVKLQRHWIETGAKILIIFEGRDAAGKDGALKALTEHMSPRQTRVVALPKPTEREAASWYFQRYVAHLPAAGEAVLFNRSWYNRAGVEPVMGFCTAAQHAEFLKIAPDFESVLVRSGVRLCKFYLDLSKSEQAQRLEDRRKDPLDFWKVGPIDAAAQEKWDDYSRRRNEMLMATHADLAPWTIVKANKKKKARLAILRHILAEHDYPKKNKDLKPADPTVLFRFEADALADGRLAK